MLPTVDDITDIRSMRSARDSDSLVHLAAAKAAIVLVLSEPEAEGSRVIDQHDLGQATRSMTLAPQIRTSGVAISAIGHQEAYRRIVGGPPDHACAYMIAFGYPGGRPLRPIVKPDRRPYNGVVHRDR
jgi:hypothetical protein